MTKIKLLSIILPTYNEVENIIALIKSIKTHVRYPHEIIVVDDNSPDGTSLVLKQYKKSHPQATLTVIIRNQNHGLTNSIRDGINAAKGDTVLWMDCDFSHPPRVIPNLLTKIEQGYSVAFASRYIKGGKMKDIAFGSKNSKVSVFSSQLVNKAVRFLLGGRFYDYTSGFVAVRKNVFHSFKLRGDYGEYFIDFLYKAQMYKYKIIEIPFVSKPRQKGESKTGGSLLKFIRRGIKYILLIIRLFMDKKPFHTSS